MPSLFVAFAKNAQDGGGFGNHVLSNASAPSRSTSIKTLETAVQAGAKLTAEPIVINWIVMP